MLTQIAQSIASACDIKCQPIRPYTGRRNITVPLQSQKSGRKRCQKNKWKKSKKKRERNLLKRFLVKHTIRTNETEKNNMRNKHIDHKYCITVRAYIVTTYCSLVLLLPLLLLQFLQTFSHITINKFSQQSSFVWSRHESNCACVYGLNRWQKKRVNRNIL